MMMPNLPTRNEPGREHGFLSIERSQLHPEQVLISHYYLFSCLCKCRSVKSQSEGGGESPRYKKGTSLAS